MEGRHQQRLRRPVSAPIRRRLRNVILYFLTAEKDEKAADLAMNHFLKAKGMTDKFSALVILADIDSPQRHQALEKFYEDAQGKLFLSLYRVQTTRIARLVPCSFM